MKFSANVFSIGLLILGVRAQNASPTESTGCEQHGDHWHCEGPAETSIAASLLSSSVGNAGPSPTASIGCKAHGDHWDCEGPAVTSAVASAVASSVTMPKSEDHHSVEHSDDHSDEHETHDETHSGAAAPSPTESVGCELHGDHWDCDGPAATTTATASTNSTGNSTASGNSTSSSTLLEQAENGAAGSHGTSFMTVLFAGVVAIAFML
ncbi:hypothetical protein EDC01DRAFT_646996 [Geopyxis carbonaria]|nr:hypothetical protein EDC01DRAFT_646996 [Geopyxis carbonaria]